MTSRHLCSQVLVVDHIIKDAPVYESASRVARSIVSELSIHAAANVLDLFVQTLLISQTTPILDSGLTTWLQDPLSSCG
ncbi:hypothetical protein TNCV_1057251 [Trichonephila clavipes]|nr:hypothetical protein TNCV_1057251 [Trichonephila clavipes]